MRLERFREGGLPGIPFEVSWGDEAVSAKLAHPPPEGIIQVNVRSQNTRVVRRDGATSQPTPQPTPWQQEAPSQQRTPWQQEAPAPPPAAAPAPAADDAFWSLAVGEPPECVDAHGRRRL